MNIGDILILISVLFVVLELRRLRKLVLGVLPSGINEKRMKELKCPVCGVVGALNPFSGIAGEIRLDGAKAERCVICGSINVKDESFTEQVRLLDNNGYVFTIIKQQIQKCIVKATGYYDLDDERLKRMLDWSKDVTKNKDGIADDYIHSVVKRAKLYYGAQINRRIECVVTEDFSNTFLNDMKTKNQLALESVGKEIVSNHVNKKLDK